MIKLPHRWIATALTVAALVAIFSLHFLLDDNMGSNNEQDVLPVARQAADPNWIPGDWYLNQPSGYRLLFNLAIGTLAAHWGFLATSIGGRLVCYSLVALGLVLIGRRLGLGWQGTLLAVTLVLHISADQGLVAEEWFVGALEAKAPAYGLVFIAIGLLLDQRYWAAALLLGGATSLHVVVGGWMFLAVLAWLLLKRQLSLRQVALVGSIYLVASGFAIEQVIDQLFTRVAETGVAPSFLYVFARLPHHLNPLSWSADWWQKPVLYLSALAVALRCLHWQQQQRPSSYFTAQMSLAELTLLTLVPFLVGVGLADFDRQGQWLQYYPFRIADVLVPLTTCLLATCAVQQAVRGRGRQLVMALSLAWLGWICTTQAIEFSRDLARLPQFPPVDSDFEALCVWVRTQTPRDAVIVSAPARLNDFSWLAERPTIAKFKFLPQNRAAIGEWQQRLSDLGGGPEPWAVIHRKKDRKGRIARRLNAGYDQLTTAQAIALMQKYGATYFLADKGRLSLPVAQQRSTYVLYQLPAAAAISPAVEF